MDINALSLQISNFVTQLATNSWLFVGNFLVFIALVIIMIAISYRSRGGIIALIVSMYVGYSIYIAFPYTDFLLSFATLTIVKAIVSILLYIIACIPGYIFIKRLTHGGFGILSFVPRFALSFLAAAFVMSIAYHVFALNHLYSFPKPLDQLFAPNEYFFWWFIAALAGLLFFVH